jgi:hypothetical protein
VRFRSDSANVISDALLSCSPVAALPSPSRSTSTSWVFSAKSAPPVTRSKRLMFTSSPETAVTSPRTVTGIDTGGISEAPGSTGVESCAV